MPIEVRLFELSTCVVEGAELDRYACADADEWCQGAFVECKWAFLFEDLVCTVKRGGVSSCCLKANFDDIYLLLDGVMHSFGRRFWKIYQTVVLI